MITFVKRTKHVPASSVGQPQQCPVHGTTTWWQRPDLSLVCDRCHPQCPVGAPQRESQPDRSEKARQWIRVARRIETNADVSTRRTVRRRTFPPSANATGATVGAEVRA